MTDQKSPDDISQSLSASIGTALGNANETINAELASNRQHTHRTAQTADQAKINLSKLKADHALLKNQQSRLDIELIDCEHNIAAWTELLEASQ